MTSTFIKDAAERVVSSFLEAVLALLVSGGVSSLNASTVHVLLVAGLTAAFATAKTILAAKSSNTVSPASLVKKTAHKARDAGFGVFELCAAVVGLAVFVWLVVFLSHHH